MSYPQPNANDASLNGAPFFRLNTLLSSPGDIYESEQGSAGLVIGPDSDVANVEVAYYDPQVPNNFMQFATISPQRGLMGTIAARNDARYAPSQRPGRFLFWIDDIYDPNFRPRSFNSGTDSIQFVAPRLDVLQYFAPQQSLGPGRSDKSFVFQNYIVSGTLFIVVPYYGRKYCYVNFTNRDTTQQNTFGILGVNYCITQDGSPNPYHQESTIRSPAAVAPNGGSVTVVVRASNQGMFDALVFSVNAAGPAPLRIIVSDVPQG